MSSYREQMKKRFHELDVQRGALMEKLDPFHKTHKDLVRQIQALEAEAKKLHDEHMRPLRDQLYTIEVERGELVRFLRDADGKTRLGKREEFLSAEEIAAVKAQRA